MQALNSECKPPQEDQDDHNPLSKGDFDFGFDSCSPCSAGAHSAADGIGCRIIQDRDLITNE